MAELTGRSEILTGDPKDDAIITHIQRLYSVGLRQTRSIRRQWLLNAAFSRGQQHCVLHSIDNRLLYFNAPPGRKRVTDDHVGPWKEHMVANIVAALPEFTCIPNQFTGDDISTARAGKALLQHYWNEWRFKRSYIELASHLVDFGNALVYANYIEDGTKFRTETGRDPITGKPAVDQNGDTITIQTTYGDIACSVLPPHVVFTNQDTTSLRDKPSVLIVQKRTLDYLVSNYPDKAKNLTSEFESPEDAFPITRAAKHQHDKEEFDRELNEYIYLQKPCRQNPKGMVAVMAGGKVLLKQDWPFKKLTTYNMVLFQYQPEAGEFLARSRIDRQIDLQKAINLVWSILLENYDDMVHIKWLIANQAGVPQITDDNAMIRYTYPYKPEQAAPSPLPNWALELLNYLYRALQDAQNYHGASMGTSVAGVRSESQAESLREQDALPLTTLDEMVKEGFAELGEIILTIAAEKLTDERLISYTNSAGVLQVKKFRGSMLGNVPKVQVRLSGTYLRNGEATANRIIQMAQMGLITDNRGMPDTDRILRLLEFKIPDSEFERMRISTEQAYRNNDRLMAGQEVIVQPWQNFKMHLDVTEELLNSSEFMELFDAPDQNRAIIDLAMNHWLMLQQQYQQNMMMLSQANAAQSGQSQPGAGKQGAPEQNNKTRPA